MTTVTHLTSVPNLPSAEARVPRGGKARLSLKDAVAAYNRAVLAGEALIRAARREAALMVAEARDAVLYAKQERDLEADAIDEYSAAEAILSEAEGEL